MKHTRPHHTTLQHKHNHKLTPPLFTPPTTLHHNYSEGGPADRGEEHSEVDREQEEGQELQAVIGGL